MKFNAYQTLNREEGGVSILWKLKSQAFYAPEFGKTKNNFQKLIIGYWRGYGNMFRKRFSSQRKWPKYKC